VRRRESRTLRFVTQPRRPVAGHSQEPVCAATCGVAGPRCLVGGPGRSPTRSGLAARPSHAGRAARCAVRVTSRKVERSKKASGLSAAHEVKCAGCRTRPPLSGQRSDMVNSGAGARGARGPEEEAFFPLPPSSARGDRGPAAVAASGSRVGGLARACWAGAAREGAEAGAAGRWGPSWRLPGVREATPRAATPWLALLRDGDGTASGSACALLRGSVLAAAGEPAAPSEEQLGCGCGCSACAGPSAGSPSASKATGCTCWQMSACGEGADHHELEEAGTLYEVVAMACSACACAGKVSTPCVQVRGRAGAESVWRSWLAVGVEGMVGVEAAGGPDGAAAWAGGEETHSCFSPTLCGDRHAVSKAWAAQRCGPAAAAAAGRATRGRRPQAARGSAAPRTAAGPPPRPPRLRASRALSQQVRFDVTLEPTLTH
jgi:hypothetical protein